MWIVTKDKLAKADPEGTNRIGHSESHSRIPAEAYYLGIRSEVLPFVDDEGTELPMVRFRLYDDDGNYYYGGWLHDDPACDNQSSCLKWGEGDAGCTMIKVKRHDKWVLEIG